MSCRFCEGKIIHNWVGFDGTDQEVEVDEVQDSALVDGIRLLKFDCLMAPDLRKRGTVYYLEYDSSSGEYATETISINYCPFCGKKLDNEVKE